MNLVVQNYIDIKIIYNNNNSIHIYLFLNLELYRRVNGKEKDIEHTMRSYLRAGDCL